MPERPLSAGLISRREALLRFAGAMGGTMVGGSALLTGCATPDARPAEELFSPGDVEWLDAVAETILPETGTPGARAARVGEFMTLMVADTYRAREQERFFAGVDAIEAASQAEYGTGFLGASPAQRLALLQRFDRDQYEYMQRREADMPVHPFRMIKELTLQGYFTSEIGYTQAMRYAETPGRFDPCVPYTPGDRAWAPHA